MGEMARNGDTDLMEERVIEKFLRSMPKRYTQIVNSIEMLLDFEQLTIEDVTGWLKSVQDREQAPESDSAAVSGKLMYTAEQWRTFNNKKEDAGPSKDRRWCPAAARRTSRVTTTTWRSWRWRWGASR
jgi:hypothetical protein